MRAVKNIASTKIGSGAYGAVFPIREKVGNCDAVVKIIQRAPNQTKEEIRREVSHLKQVGQFIGWGRIASPANGDERVDYLIMPNMGDRPEPLPFSEHEDRALRKEAAARYSAKYHMRHK